MKIVEIKEISMMYNLQAEKIESLKEYVVKLLKRQLKSNKFWALKDVSLDIEKGESLAIIGRNGAGKSTLLRLIAGVMNPTKGSVNTNGTAALLSLGTGFDSNMTAKENIFLNGAMLGRSRKEMKERYDSIVEFAELQDFMNVPIKNFSSGMVARLGFAIATDVNAEILICDEVLSVGDISFRKKCEDRIKQIHAAGTTFILVSHSMDQVKKLCQKAVWLDHGEVRMFGSVQEVSKAYIDEHNREQAEKAAAQKAEEAERKAAEATKEQKAVEAEKTAETAEVKTLADTEKPAEAAQKAAETEKPAEAAQKTAESEKPAEVVKASETAVIAQKNC